MRKLVSVLLALSLVFSLFIGSVWANEPSEEDFITITEVTDEEEGTEEEIGDEPVTTPESPFYFLKRFIESVRLLLTFDQEKKVSLLEELAEERARELAALQDKYNEGEISDEQLTLLETAMDDLVLYVEKLIDELAKLDEPNEVPEDEGDPEPEDESEPADDEIEVAMDKYQWRIAHLQAIADQAPEAAQKGLARAMANAERQRTRAIEKGKLPADEEVEEEPAGDHEDDENLPDSDGTVAESEAEVGETTGSAVQSVGKQQKEKKEKNESPGRGRPANVPGNGRGLEKQ